MNQLSSREPSRTQVVVEEELRCPECGGEHIVRDYARGEIVCDTCGLVISESQIDEGPEWTAYSGGGEGFPGPESPGPPGATRGPGSGACRRRCGPWTA